MSELALKLIAENKKRATFLDLGNCGLTEVPDYGELVYLQAVLFVSI